MPPISMSEDELQALPAAVPLDTAARAFGVGRTKARELVRQGAFPCPVLPLGRRLMVTRHALFTALGIDKPAGDEGTTPDSAHAPIPAARLPEPPEAVIPPGYIVIAVPASPAMLNSVLATLSPAHPRQMRDVTEQCSDPHGGQWPG